MIRAFETSFVTQYQTAFTELVRLGSVAAQKRVEGKETSKEDSIAQRLFIVLQALDSDGLSAKQVEALEYCLFRLNESLTTPTVEALVNVSPVHDPVVYRMSFWAGLFRINEQQFSMSKSSRISFENGSFSIGGQDISFHRSQNMSFDKGNFALSFNNIGLTYVPATPSTDLVLSLTLNELVIGDMQWRAIFDAEILEVTGDGDTDSSSIGYFLTNTVRVYKLSNSGIAEEDGDVTFLLNGVAVDTQAFVTSDNLDGTGPSNQKLYTYLSLSPADSLEVIITEGSEE